MTVLEILRQAGWTASELGNALGVITLESGGDPTAHNTAGEDSRGWFQINVGSGAHTQWAGENLFDPLTNARLALQLWQWAGDWRDWWNAAGILGLPPRGDYRHSVEEFAALADKDVEAGGNGNGGGEPATPSAAAVVLSVGLAVVITALLID